MSNMHPSRHPRRDAPVARTPSTIVHPPTAPDDPQEAATRATIRLLVAAANARSALGHPGIDRDKAINDAIKKQLGFSGGSDVYWRIRELLGAVGR